MKRAGAVAALTVSLLSGVYVAYAGQQMPMSFFVTSVSVGKGGDLGGLAGADAHCAMLAQAAGSTGKIWRAYLSTQARPGQPAVNARDRIGQGPWYNSKGQPISQNQAELHGDTLEMAQRGSDLYKQSALNEKGVVVNGVEHARRADRLAARRPCVYGQYGPHVQQLDEQRHGLRSSRPLRSQRRRQHIVELRTRFARVQPAGSGRNRRRGPVLLLRDQLTLAVITSSCGM
jgi:hypothetical protein